MAKKTAAQSKKRKSAKAAVKPVVKGKGKQPKAGVKKVMAAVVKPVVVKAAAAAPASSRFGSRKEVEESQAPLTDEQLRKVKTGLSKRDLDHYQELLMQKRKQLLGDVASLQTDRMNNTGGNLSNLPLHMADVGSDNYEQEFTLGLVESERKLLREIDDALIRIQNGTFGVCLERGVPIKRERLDAKPWAKYCIEVALERERRGLGGQM